MCVLLTTSLMRLCHPFLLNLFVLELNNLPDFSTLAEEIDAALLSHVAWKHRLRTATLSAGSVNGLPPSTPMNKEATISNASKHFTPSFTSRPVRSRKCSLTATPQRPWQLSTALITI